MSRHDLFYLALLGYLIQVGTLELIVIHDEF
jgi:hypothetical protein